jgi:cell wall-associated NlpC family hydrolase
MKKLILVLFAILSVSACKSRKRSASKKTRTSVVKKSTKKRNSTTVATSNTARSVIKNAEQFNGIRYKYGGTTKQGMDCSGLIYTAFKKEAISLPRTTRDLSKKGQWIDLKEVKAGDLLFFATKKNNRAINHVGLVTHAQVGRVEFIHSTSSKGVITSLLSERYWYFAFVQARRVL